MRAWLISASPKDDAGTVQERRFSAGLKRPWAVDAAERIVTLPTLTLEAMANGWGQAGSSARPGALTLANPDGDLDGLLDLAWEDAVVHLYTAEDGDAVNALGDMTEVAKFRGSGAAQDRAHLSVAMQDSSAALDVPLDIPRYAGTGGAEGPAELENVQKLCAIGPQTSVEGKMVDRVALIIQVHFRAINALNLVTDRGVELTIAEDYADFASLKAADLSDPSYDGKVVTCLAEGMFRLAREPSGLVVADFEGDAGGSGYVEQPGSVIQRVFELLWNGSGITLDTAALGQLDTDFPYPVKLFTDREGPNVSDWIETAAVSAGALWWVSPLAELTAALFDYAGSETELHDWQATEPRLMDSWPRRNRMILGYRTITRIHSADELAEIQTLNARGAWDAGATYERNDIVTHNGGTWRWQTETPGNNEPPSGDWELMAAPGADGTDGTDGASLFVEYSADGTSWHTGFQASDIYMRQKVGSGGTWSDAIQIVGEDGAAGDDGNFTQYVFKRQSSQPSTPTGDGIPTGWSDAPPTPDSDPLWMSKAEQEPDGTLVGSWSTPVKWTDTWATLPDPDDTKPEDNADRTAPRLTGILINGDFEIGTEEGWSGLKEVRRTGGAADGSWVGVVDCASGGPNARNNKWIAVSPGERVYMSCQARAVGSPDSNASLAPRWADGTRGTAVDTMSINDTDWTPVRGLFTVPSGRTRFQFDFGEANGTQGEYEFDSCLVAVFPKNTDIDLLQATNAVEEADANNTGNNPQPPAWLSALIKAANIDVPDAEAAFDAKNLINGVAQALADVTVDNPQAAAWLATLVTSSEIDVSDAEAAFDALNLINGPDDANATRVAGLVNALVTINSMDADNAVDLLSMVPGIAPAESKTNSTGADHTHLNQSETFTTTVIDFAQISYNNQIITVEMKGDYTVSSGAAGWLIFQYNNGSGWNDLFSSPQLIGSGTFEDLFVDINPPFSGTVDFRVIWRSSNGPTTGETADVDTVEASYQMSITK